MVMPARTGSWWAVPCASRADFDQRAAAEAPRMAASREGTRLPTWTNVGARPARHIVPLDRDGEYPAIR